MLIELFGGIGSGRRALQLLSIEVACFVSVDMSEEARRVTERTFLGVHHFNDVRAFGREQLRDLRRKYARIWLIIITYGAPCQDVSGLNASGIGIAGSRSRLVEVPRIVAETKAEFEHARVWSLGENVASMKER